MAVTVVSEINQQRRGTFNQQYQRTYYRAYRVLTNNTADNAATVLAACGGGTAPDVMPVLGDNYPGDAGAFCTNAEVTAEGEDARSWVALFEFRTGSEAENPLLQLPVPTWGLNETEWPLEYDKNGKPIVNTAGVPFAEAITDQIPQATLSVQRNELISPSVWNQLANCVSLDFFQGYPPGNALYKGCTGTQQSWTDPNTNLLEVYWSNNHIFEFNTLPWGFNKYVLSAGYQQLKNGELQDILLNGARATTPQLLDESGAAIPPGGTPYFIDFQIKNQAFFGVFLFPQF